MKNFEIWPSISTRLAPRTPKMGLKSILGFVKVKRHPTQVTWWHVDQRRNWFQGKVCCNPFHRKSYTHYFWWLENKWYNFKGLTASLFFNFSLIENLFFTNCKTFMGKLSFRTSDTLWDGLVTTFLPVYPINALFIYNMRKLWPDCTVWM